MNIHWENFWKADWSQIRERLIAWWQHKGLVVNALACGDAAPGKILNEQAPFYYQMSGLDTLAPFKNDEEILAAWINPERRAALAEHFLSGIYYGGEAFPIFDTHLGPGNLATFLGSEPRFALETAWYEPCMTDPDSDPPLSFNPNDLWFLKQKAILETGMATSQGRFLVGMPDLVENLDILAALRGAQTFMVDLLERPAFVKARVREINQVYFAVFDRFFEIIKDSWGGNAFSAFCIWGPGKTAKIQCDVSAMISPRMFAEFAAPGLAEQCEWLDYSMYHLDGTQAIRHLGVLLEIESLDAIEWTPQTSAPQGGDPHWYDMYRRILAAGKSVQAIGVQPNEVIPLLDAVGPEGLYIMVNVENQSEAESLVKAVESYR